MLSALPPGYLINPGDTDWNNRTKLFLVIDKSTFQPFDIGKNHPHRFPVYIRLTKAY